MDLAEVAVGAPVMGGEADVAVPDGGVLEVSDPLGKRLAVRPLINADAVAGVSAGSVGWMGVPSKIAT